jgi:YegS/Rv2252/BmrU family lipid kinase
VEPVVWSAALIVNTRSRVGDAAFAEARDLLGELGIPLGAAYAVHDPVRLQETVREALLDGHELVILGGGDGSVSTVVDLFAGTDAVLGLLPLGTANDFARTLGIPFELGEACRTIAGGRVVDVDLGLAGDNYYVNVASVGLGSEVTEALSPRLKRAAGALAYPIAATKAYARHEPFSVRLEFPEGDYAPVALDRVVQVAVGNGRFYGGGMIVAPGSGIDDGSLDVYAIEDTGTRRLASLALGMRTGEFIEDQSVHHYRTGAVRVATEPEREINLDGEVVSRTPKTFTAARNALKVIVPRDSRAALYDAAAHEAPEAPEPPEPVPDLTEPLAVSAGRAR